MFERLVIVVGIVVAVLMVRGALRLWTCYRMEHTPVASEIAGLAGIVQEGRPAVLAFSTPGCAECRSTQRPALEKLQALMGGSVQVTHLSVPDHSALVEQFGILTVPATVILDERGVTRQINLRYTSAERLQTQLHEIGVHPNNAA